VPRRSSPGSVALEGDRKLGRDDFFRLADSLLIVGQRLVFGIAVRSHIAHPPTLSSGSPSGKRFIRSEAASCATSDGNARSPAANLTLYRRHFVVFSCFKFFFFRKHSFEAVDRVASSLR
jgi:hypothetical protein